MVKMTAVLHTVHVDSTTGVLHSAAVIPMYVAVVPWYQ